MSSPLEFKEPQITTRFERNAYGDVDQAYQIDLSPYYVDSIDVFQIYNTVHITVGCWLHDESTLQCNALTIKKEFILPGSAEKWGLRWSEVSKFPDVSAVFTKDGNLLIRSPISNSCFPQQTGSFKDHGMTHQDRSGLTTDLVNDTIDTTTGCPDMSCCESSDVDNDMIESNKRVIGRREMKLSKSNLKLENFTDQTFSPEDYTTAASSDFDDMKTRAKINESKKQPKARNSFTELPKSKSQIRTILQRQRMHLEVSQEQATTHLSPISKPCNSTPMQSTYIQNLSIESKPPVSPRKSSKPSPVSNNLTTSYFPKSQHNQSLSVPKITPSIFFPPSPTSPIENSSPRTPSMPSPPSGYYCDQISLDAVIHPEHLNIVVKDGTIKLQAKAVHKDPITGEATIQEYNEQRELPQNVDDKLLSAQLSTNGQLILWAPFKAPEIFYL